MTATAPLPPIRPSVPTARARIDFAGPEWHTKYAVPLIDAHQLTNELGQVQLDVDEEFLAQVAANNNRRFARTGDATPGILGHTTDNPADPEKPVKCWFTDFKVAPGPDGRPTLYANQHVKRKNLNILEEYPRRSVELWVGKREIDPVALLGGTTPERDLGVTKYHRDDSPVLRFSRATGDHLYRYTLGTAMPATYPPIRPLTFNGKVRYAHDDPAGPMGGEGEGEGGDPMVAKILSSAEFKSAIRSVIEEVLNEAEGGEGELPPGAEDDLFAGQGGPPGMPPGGAGASGPMPMGPGAPGGAGAPMPPLEEGRGFHEAPPVRFEEGAYGSGTNGFMPDDCGTTRGRSMQYQRYGYPGVGQPTLFDDEPYRPRVHADPQARHRLSRVEGTQTRLLDENKALRLRLARADAEKYVRELQDHGYLVDDPAYLAEQLAHFEFVPNGIKARNDFIEKIVKKNFARRENDPSQTTDLMRMSRSTSEAQVAARGPSGPEEAQKLVRYARQHGIADMAEAWAKMNAAAPK